VLIKLDVIEAHTHPASAHSCYFVFCAQDCTGNPSQEAAGFPCLAQTASFDDVAALTKDYVINIIVGGSSYPKWCNGTEEESCTSLYAGYTGSMGPW
jgi:hypothetical protein